LEAAVTADDQNISAWQTWVTLLIKDGNATAVRNVCERWMAAMPASYVACNVLADYLDKQGQTEEALRLYRRSLDIEWNQPPALQAIQRLEKKKR
jgi:Tfp pilus assembly protein PilF